MALGTKWGTLVFLWKRVSHPKINSAIPVQVNLPTPPSQASEISSSQHQGCYSYLYTQDKTNITTGKSLHSDGDIPLYWKNAKMTGCVCRLAERWSVVSVGGDCITIKNNSKGKWEKVKVTKFGRGYRTGRRRRIYQLNGDTRQLDS